MAGRATFEVETMALFDLSLTACADGRIRGLDTCGNRVDTTYRDKSSKEERGRHDGAASPGELHGGPLC